MYIARLFSLRSLLCVLYAVILTCCLLFVRFPSAKAEQYIQHQLADIFEGTSWEFGQFTMALPFSLGVTGISVRNSDGSDVVNVPQLKLTPELDGIYPGCFAEAEILGGKLSGVMTYRPGQKEIKFSEIEAENIDLNLLGYFEENIGRKVIGKLTANGQFQVDSLVEPKGGTGRAEVTVSEGELALKQKVLTLDAIAFETLRFVLEYRSGNVEISEGKLKGEEFNADFNGTLGITGPFADNTIALEGEFTVRPELIRRNPQLVQQVRRMQQQFRTNRIPFEIKGTLGRPSLVIARNEGQG